MNKIVEESVQDIITSRQNLVVELVSIVVLWVIGTGILGMTSPLLFSVEYGTGLNLVSMIAPALIYPAGLLLTVRLWRKRRYDSALITSFLSLVLILISLANLRM